MPWNIDTPTPTDPPDWPGILLAIAVVLVCGAAMVGLVLLVAALLS